MAEKKVIIQNKDGIHCRPSSIIISTAQEFPEHQFMVKSANGETELDSILSLLTLGLKKGDEITITVNGPNADVVCEKLAEQFETNFDFPRNESG